jgi:DNA-binding transcriptional ArsR family regulator
MPEPDLALDRLIHEPGRLAILTVLSAAAEADFLFLQRATGLTKGNLSSHLARLEAAGLVTVQKRFVGRKPNTRLELTADGRERIARHWAQLDRLRETASRASRAPRAAPGASG